MRGRPWHARGGPTLPALLLVVSLLAQPQPGLAAQTEDACAALVAVRMKLLEMVDSRGRGDPDALKREVYASSTHSSTRLEGEVGALRGDVAARAIAIRRIWEPFKRTREQEILPALYRGQYARARAIACGVQAERYEQMRAALGCP